jgi:hypothetical protein
MERRDYLLRQIQFMMQTLAALIRKLTGLKDTDEEEEIRIVTDTILKENLNTSLEEILKVPVSEIADFMHKVKGVHISNIDLLAEVFFLNANSAKDSKVTNDLLVRALELLEWTDRTYKVFSLERYQKIQEIQLLLKRSGTITH